MNRTDVLTRPIHKRIYKDRQHQIIEKILTNLNIVMILRNMKAMLLKREGK